MKTTMEEPEIKLNIKPKKRPVLKAAPDSAAWRAKWIGLDESHPEVLRMAKAFERMAGVFYRHAEEPRLMVVTGRNGIGKTHAARALVAYCQRIAYPAWQAGHWTGTKVPTAEFCKWDEITRTPYGTSGQWEDIIDADLAVLDDVGSEIDRYRSGETTLALKRALEDRVARYTVITTNVPKANWAAAWDKRVEDRLYRHGFIVEVPTAPSWWRKDKTP